MINLPYPPNRKGIHHLLEDIDERLLNCSERFIRQQVRRPILSLLQQSSRLYSLDSPQSDWFNIYSIYSANQQLNEACNKLWATVELANVTSRKVWKKSYQPLGEEFHGAFLLGTLIPTLYYSQISAIISILSSFGCVPILAKKVPCYLIRTQEGWGSFQRGSYLKQVLGLNARSWHDRIIMTYKGLIDNGVKLPRISFGRTQNLKRLRNAMHYEVLGDLRMWRMFRKNKAYLKHLPLTVKIVEVATENLSEIKKVTTGCDHRFQKLKENLSNTSWYR